MEGWAHCPDAMFSLWKRPKALSLEARIEAATGLPCAAVVGLLERGGERAASVFLMICRDARKRSPQADFDETVLHCFALLPKSSQDKLTCLMASVAVEALCWSRP
ncbi:MAG: hypothetical protein K0S06_100 [Microvirga sp.]|jgi:hypothetical protein|nr:hypothetical protein [Microvirga sp.]